MIVEEGFLHEDPLIVKLCQMVHANAYHAWVCSIAGCDMTSPPAWRRRYKLITEPRVGDLVVEVSGGYRFSDPAAAVGTLMRIAREPCRKPEEGEGETEEDVLATFYYIEDVTGREVRWENCRFIRAFRDSKERYEAEEKTR